MRSFQSTLFNGTLVRQLWGVSFVLLVSVLSINAVPSCTPQELEMIEVGLCVVPGIQPELNDLVLAPSGSLLMTCSELEDRVMFFGVSGSQNEVTCTHKTTEIAGDRINGPHDLSAEHKDNGDGKTRAIVTSVETDQFFTFVMEDVANGDLSKIFSSGVPNDPSKADFHFDSELFAHIAYTPEDPSATSKKGKLSAYEMDFDLAKPIQAIDVPVFDSTDVGYNPIEVAAAPNGQRVVVVNHDSDPDEGNQYTISLIDLVGNTLGNIYGNITHITGISDGPSEIAITSDSSCAYITSKSRDAVDVIDLQSKMKVATITQTTKGEQAFFGPNGVDILEDDNTGAFLLFVTNSEQPSITVMLAGLPTQGCVPLITEDILVQSPSTPEALIVDPNKSLVFVATSAHGVIVFKVIIPT